MDGADLGTTKRGRGRPIGSTRHKEVDSRIVARAGDAMLADTALTTRAAIVRAVKRETGKDDANALRRVQNKMDRTVAVAAASERKKARRRQDEHNARTLLSVLDFLAGGPTFQRFVAQPEVQQAARNVMMFCMGMQEMAEHINKQFIPVAQAVAPVLAELQKAKARTVIEMPRLR